MKVEDREDGWSVVIGDDGTERFRFKLPPGPISLVEMNAFVEHVLKVVREREHGPS